MEWIHLVNIILVNTGLEFNNQVRLYSSLHNKLQSLRADVSYFLCFTQTEWYRVDNIMLCVWHALRGH